MKMNRLVVQEMVVEGGITRSHDEVGMMEPNLKVSSVHKHKELLGTDSNSNGRLVCLCIPLLDGQRLALDTDRLSPKPIGYHYLDSAGDWNVGMDGGTDWNSNYIYSIPIQSAEDKNRIELQGRLKEAEDLVESVRVALSNLGPK